MQTAFERSPQKRHRQKTMPLCAVPTVIRGKCSRASSETNSADEVGQFGEGIAIPGGVVGDVEWGNVDAEHVLSFELETHVSCYYLSPKGNESSVKVGKIRKNLSFQKINPYNLSFFLFNLFRTRYNASKWPNMWRLHEKRPIWHSRKQNSHSMGSYRDSSNTTKRHILTIKQVD